MIGLHPDCPADLTLLADHLDTALAVGEELLALSLPARSDLDDRDPETAPAAMDLFVRRLMQLEAALLLRLLRARRLASGIGRADAALKSVGDLFRAQTALFHTMILEAGDGGEGELTRPGDSHAYLRSRGLIAPEAAAPSPFESVAVSEVFRVGGIAPLGQVLDLVSALLDLLDARYGLYSPDVDDEDAPDEAETAFSETGPRQEFRVGTLAEAIAEATAAGAALAQATRNANAGDVNEPSPGDGADVSAAASDRDAARSAEAPQGNVNPSSPAGTADPSAGATIRP
jgi:hypothetical protein